ncbi:MAG: ABC transporter ATP-binding protein [Desulfobacterales bacterium]|nr:ABC transporter ATP-binding protein [Desulfobacterales bacterium]
MKSLRLIKPYFIQELPTILLGVASLILVDFFQLVIPRIIKWTVDDLTTRGIAGAGLLRYALYIVAAAAGIAVFRYIWRRCLIGYSRLVEEGLRNRLFAHVQTLSASQLDKMKSGDLMAHATNDIQNIRMAAGMGVVAMTDALVLGSAAIGFMAYISVRLTLLVLIPMPLLVLSSRLLGKRMLHMYGAVQGAFSDMTETVRERLAGIRIVKAHHRENAALARVEASSRSYIRQNIGLMKIVGFFFPMMFFFTNLSLALVLLLGGGQTITGQITPGDFVAFISYLNLLTWPMMAMGWVTNLLQRGRASLDRINKILQMTPRIVDSPGAVSPRESGGEIVFENVSFSYKETAADETASAALDGVNLRIPRGRILGIVGPPGAGKTTLANLIPRLYDATDGRILLQGVDIREIRLADLRASIGLTPQEPFLFAGTIRQNILLADETIPGEALESAVRKARLHETIQSFPNGFDTLVGEKGVILSGGQKQRIALARAFLKETPILILDDPISQVDTETGDHIVNAIRDLSGDKTIIIISHRLSAVRFADRIISLDQGRIAEDGSHEQLMERNAYYAKTYRLQEMEGGGEEKVS